MKVLIEKAARYEGSDVEPGSVVEVPDALGERWKAAGIARKPEPRKAAKPQTPEKTDRSKKPEKREDEG